MASGLNLLNLDRSLPKVTPTRARITKATLNARRVPLRREARKNGHLKTQRIPSVAFSRNLGWRFVPPKRRKENYSLKILANCSVSEPANTYKKCLLWPPLG